MLIKNMSTQSPVTESSRAADPFKQVSRSLEILLGGVLMLLTIGTVFVFSGLKADPTYPSLFLTHWPAEFAAPVLTFVSGLVVFLRRERSGDVRATRRFLVTRGLLLIILQVTWLRTAWTFNFNYYDYELAGLMWMLGWSLLVLACCVGLSPIIVGLIGLLIIATHQGMVMLSSFPRAVYRLLYLGGRIDIGPFNIEVLYALIPWIGVMMVGYALGAVMQLPQERRRKIALRLGGGITLAFLIIATIRATLGGGDEVQIGIDILAQRALPPSQLLLMMTLGPLITLIPLAEDLTNKFADFLASFGRVSLFYYLVHLPIAHALAFGVSLARTGKVDGWLFGNHPAESPAVPPGYAWDVWQVFAVTIVVIALMYPAVRWYGRRKLENPDSWMTYI